MKMMAEVLAAHRTIDVALYPDYYCCSCGHKGLEQPSEHQANMLTAAGFGSVKEAAAKALEDVDNYVDEVMFHEDEETGTGPLVAGRGPLVCLLRERAAALRGEA